MVFRMMKVASSCFVKDMEDSIPNTTKNSEPNNTEDSEPNDTEESEPNNTEESEPNDSEDFDPTDTPEKCERKEITNGNVEIEGITATYSCYDGYLLQGPRTRTCRNGNWTDLMPSCIEKCPEMLSNILNGFIKLNRLKTVATYNCSDNYTLMGVMRRWCINGNWSGRVPSCAMSCSEVLYNISNGYVILRQRGLLAAYNCREDYALDGRWWRRCINGTWNGKEPSCRRICNNVLKNISNGYAQFNSRRTAAIYSCEAGYFLSGNRRRQCHKNGELSGKAPSCDLKHTSSILGSSLGISLPIAAMICATVGVLGFLLFFFKSRKKYEPLEENVYYSAYAEYAEIGPGSSDSSVIYNSKAEYQKFADEGVDLNYETQDWNEEDIYVVPPSEEDILYEHLKNNATKDIPRDSINLKTRLGAGEFGEVYRGVWSSAESSKNVAVKTLKKSSQSDDRVKFLQEAFIMMQFEDPNVVTMYGVVTDGEPIMLILELLPNGDLRNYLLKMKSNTIDVHLDDHTLLSYCRQVVSGMVYLSAKHFVHRDLAARNILVSVDGICKIADFGMSRDLLYESYYVSHGGLIPVKWTAPEALHYKKYSTASDVWSYGAVMYEIWSVGCKPFENLPNKMVMSLLESGYKLSPPPGCPRMIYKIMIECWDPEPVRRLSFVDIRRKLSLPDSKLLKWDDEDKNVHTDATVLGASISSGQNLYPELQKTYK